MREQCRCGCLDARPRPHPENVERASPKSPLGTFFFFDRPQGHARFSNKKGISCRWQRRAGSLLAMFASKEYLVSWVYWAGQSPIRFFLTGPCSRKKKKNKSDSCRREKRLAQCGRRWKSKKNVTRLCGDLNKPQPGAKRGPSTHRLLHCRAESGHTNRDIGEPTAFFARVHRARGSLGASLPLKEKNLACTRKKDEPHLRLARVSIPFSKQEERRP
nr:hypothetical protein [Pandoravirus massiliensis]